MTLIKTGGIAALICAATYMVGFALLLTLLAPLGYGTDTIDPVAFAAHLLPYSPTPPVKKTARVFGCVIHNANSGNLRG